MPMRPWSLSTRPGPGSKRTHLPYWQPPAEILDIPNKANCRLWRSPFGRLAMPNEANCRLGRHPIRPVIVERLLPPETEPTIGTGSRDHVVTTSVAPGEERTASVVTTKDQLRDDPGSDPLPGGQGQGLL